MMTVFERLPRDEGLAIFGLAVLSQLATLACTLAAPWFERPAAR